MARSTTPADIKADAQEIVREVQELTQEVQDLVADAAALPGQVGDPDPVPDPGSDIPPLPYHQLWQGDVAQVDAWMFNFKPPHVYVTMGPIQVGLIYYFETSTEDTPTDGDVPFTPATALEIDEALHPPPMNA